MSFELENPEIALLVSDYNDGKIAYQDAKMGITRLLVSDEVWLSGLYSIEQREAEKEAKKLLLGE